MKLIHYLIAIFTVIAGMAWSTGWFNDSDKQSKVGSVMIAVKSTAINAVDSVTEGAADAVNAADEMGNVAEKTLEKVLEELGEE
jgi:hypothetical protein